MENPMVTVTSFSMVKPIEPIPNTNIQISDCDQDNPISHTPVVYIYSHPKTDFASACQALKTSLSKVLVHFHPVAGRVYMTEGGRVRHEQNSAGVAFYVAESELKIEDFIDFAPSQELHSVVPPIDYVNVPLHDIPVLLVQLTKLKCGGFTLGTLFSHIIIDASSAAHFMSEWSRISRGEALEVPPFLDRTILMGSDPPVPPMFRHPRYEPSPLLIGQTDATEERKKETVLVVLHLSNVQVAALKLMANEGRGDSTRPYSRFEAIAGHLWKCACKARGHQHEQRTRMNMTVSFRNRVPVPKGYFGSAMLRQVTECQSGELMTKHLGYAASKVRESVDVVTPEFVKSALDCIKSQPDMNRFRTIHTVGSPGAVFNGNPNMEVTSWLNIPLRGLDFGWGKEIFMGHSSLNSDGKCIIRPGLKDDGSVSVIIRLQVAHIDNFRKFFYGDIFNASNYGFQ